MPVRRVMCAYCREFLDRDSPRLRRLVQLCDRARVGWACLPCMKRLGVPEIPAEPAHEEGDEGEDWKRGKKS